MGILGVLGTIAIVLAFPLGYSMSTKALVGITLITMALLIRPWVTYKEIEKLLALYYTVIWIVFVVIMWAIAAYFRIDAIGAFFNSPSFSWLFR